MSYWNANTQERIVAQAEKRLKQRLLRAGNDPQRIARAYRDYETVIKSGVGYETAATAERLFI